MSEWTKNGKKLERRDTQKKWRAKKCDERKRKADGSL